MVKRIDEILAGMSFTESKNNNQEAQIDTCGKETSSVWLERNIGKYPIYFTGSEKAKLEIEKKIAQSKKPYIITKEQTENGYKMLALSPAAAYGLIDGDDAKVVAAIFSYLQEEIRPKLGEYPRTFLISIREICERMYLVPVKNTYKRIKRALETVDSCTIVQTDFFKTRLKKKGEEITETERNLHIFRLVKIHKVDRKIDSGLKNKINVVEIQLEDWMRRNLENYFATKVDKEIFFQKLTSQRSRILFNRLCAVNFRKEVFFPTSEIVALLWIMDEENKNRKLSIVRAIDPLVGVGFLELYDFGWDKTRFVFSKVRQAKKGQVIPEGEKIKIDSITLKILETLGGIKSERLFRKIAQGVPEDLVYACLSQVKELQRDGKITESSVGYFVTLIGLECDKRGIKSPFKRKMNTVQQLEIDGKR